MGKCADYATGKLDLDLDDEVPRTALADCLDSGWTADEIAEELGLEGASAVVSWCLYHDLPLPKVHEPPAAPKKSKRRRGARPLIEIQREREELDRKIAALYREGHERGSIARKLKVKTDLVGEALKRQGVALRPRCRKPQPPRRPDLIAIAHAALVAAGATPQDIASILRPGSGEIAAALRIAKTQDTP